MNCLSSLLSTLLLLCSSALKLKSARHTKDMAPAKTLQTHLPGAPRAQPLLLSVRDLRIYFAFFIYHKKHARRFKQISKKEYNLYKEWKKKKIREQSPKIAANPARQVELVRTFFGLPLDLPALTWQKRRSAYICMSLASHRAKQSNSQTVKQSTHHQARTSKAP